MKEHVFISGVIYVYNNEKIIKEFLVKIDKIFYENFISYEIIVVNDASQDLTEQAIYNVSKELRGKVTLINLAWKHGIELAMLAGCDFSMGDFIYEIEFIDSYYTTEIFKKLYKTAIKGYDIVSATPITSLKLTSRIFYSFLNRVSYLKMDLTTETVRIVSRRALNAVIKGKEKLRYRKALYKYTGFPQTNIKYFSKVKYISDGRNLFEKFSLAFNILLSFSNIGLRLAFIFAIIFFMISIIGGIYTVIVYFTLKSVIEGWTTLMLFISFGFSGFFLILAIIGKYLSMILTEIHDRPAYTVRNAKLLSKQ